MAPSGRKGARPGEEPGREAPLTDPVEVVRSEEELHVVRRDETFGSARLVKTVVERPVSEDLELLADHVEVVELPVPDPDADSGVTETTAEGDLSVPVLAERLVVRKETYVSKRILLRRTRQPHARQRIEDVLRAERVDVEVDRAPAPEERAGARALAGEDLSRGPTPETRHPDGTPDDVRDTTQGPTPEIRRAVRAADDDRAAAGEPRLDRATRADRGGGGQDLEEPDVTVESITIEPDDPVVRVDEARD